MNTRKELRNALMNYINANHNRRPNHKNRLIRAINAELNNVQTSAVRAANTTVKIAQNVGTQTSFNNARKAINSANMAVNTQNLNTVINNANRTANAAANSAIIAYNSGNKTLANNAIRAANNTSIAANNLGILGLSKNATMNNIKRAYRRLVLQHHPNKGGNRNKFQKITNAYHRLTTKTNNKYGNATVGGRFIFNQNNKKNNNKYLNSTVGGRSIFNQNNKKNNKYGNATVGNRSIFNQNNKPKSFTRRALDLGKRGVALGLAAGGAALAASRRAGMRLRQTQIPSGRPSFR